MYNLTYLDNSFNVFELFVGTNNLVNGLIGIMILVAIFVILLIVLRIRFTDRLIAAGVITTIISIGFWAVGLVGLQIIIYPLIFMFTGIIINLFSD